MIKASKTVYDNGRIPAPARGHACAAQMEGHLVDLLKVVCASSVLKTSALLAQKQS